MLKRPVKKSKAPVRKPAPTLSEFLEAAEEGKDPALRCQRTPAQWQERADEIKRPPGPVKKPARKPREPQTAENRPEIPPKGENGSQDPFRRSDKAPRQALEEPEVPLLTLEAAARQWLRADWTFRQSPKCFTGEAQEWLVQAERAMRKALTGETDLVKAHGKLK